MPLETPTSIEEGADCPRESRRESGTFQIETFQWLKADFQQFFEQCRNLLGKAERTMATLCQSEPVVTSEPP